MDGKTYASSQHVSPEPSLFRLMTMFKTTKNMALSRPFVSVMLAHKFVLNLNYFLWTGFTKTCRYSSEVPVYRLHGCDNRYLWGPRAIVPDLTMIYWFVYIRCVQVNGRQSQHVDHTLVDAWLLTLQRGIYVNGIASTNTRHTSIHTISFIKRIYTLTEN